MSLYDDIVAAEAALDTFEDEIRGRHETLELAEKTARDDGVPLDLLTIGLVGGTGVGKSTLVNALAGHDISATSERRPTTDRIIPYVHDDRRDVLSQLGFITPHLSDAHAVHDADRLRSILLFDLPDMDSLERGHAEVVRDALKGLDVVVWVTSLTKYGDRVFHEWIETWSAGMDLGNVYFVLNKVDELDESDLAAAAKSLTDNFESTVKEVLGRVSGARGTPAYFTVSARRAKEAIPGNAFTELEASLFRERDARELERIKSSNRVALLGRRLRAVRTALRLDDRRKDLRAEYDEVRAELDERCDLPEVRAEVEGLLLGSTARDTIAASIFRAELGTWPLLPRLRLLTAPLRQAARMLTRAQALSGLGGDDDGEPGGPLPSLRGHLLDVQSKRRKRRSLLAEPGEGGKDDPRTIDRWIRELENECLARAESAAHGSSEAPKVGVGGKFLRHLLVWGPLLWFPLLQPLLQEILNPERGVASLPLRLTHRMVRITGAMHLLVSLIFILVVYAALMIVLRGLAHRAAAVRCRELAHSTGWSDGLKDRVSGLILGDVERALRTIDDETARLSELDDDLAALKTRAE